MQALLSRLAAWHQLAAAALIRVAVGVLTWPHTAPAAVVLAGWDSAAVTYMALVWAAVRGMDATATEQLANREDPSNSVAEVLLLGASVAALIAIGFCLLRAGHAAGAMKAFLLGLGALSLALSWLTVQTVFMLRYARGYYQRPAGGIDFNQDQAPAYMDFAYISFTLGMTFQVSDTNITTRPIRRVVLHHALLSYVFGAVILAVAINIVASLLR